MLNIESLEKCRKEKVEAWFKEWWEEINLVEEIIKMNDKGILDFVIGFGPSNFQHHKFVTDPFFEECLKKELVGFNIRFYKEEDTGDYCVHINWGDYLDYEIKERS